MTRLLRDFRLVPIVLFATISLFALKTIGLVIDGHYTLDATSVNEGADITGTIPSTGGSPSPPGKPPPGKQADKQPDKQSWAQQMFGYPDITGAVGEAKPAEKKPAESRSAEGKSAEPKEAAGKGNRATTPEEPPKGKPGWTAVPLDRGRPQSPAETAILERLQERRAELDARAKELDMRESLLKAAEKRLEPHCRVQGSGIARQQFDPAARRGRCGAFQERGHHVREHEGEGRRQDLRSPRAQDPGRGRKPDQPAPDVRHPRADAAGCGPAAYRRARRPLVVQGQARRAAQDRRQDDELANSE
jgi:hypothetical protein